MTAPRTTTWELEPHTRAKHEILHRYLQAWMAIVGTSFPEMLYVDGFAGPGCYSGGELGSPVLALDAALSHENRLRGKRVRFLFVEQNPDRAAALQKRVNEMDLPANFDVTVASGKTFEEAVRDLLRGHLPPTFAFVDPFGFTRVPFSIVKEIARRPRCEVLITLMFEEINRFLSLPEQAANYDELFGSPRWRKAIPLSGAPRNAFLRDLYLGQLRKDAGLKYVRAFEMRNERDRTDYYLCYGTSNRLGLQKMKEAMWKVDPQGTYRFSDATNANQLVLFDADPLDILERQIADRFRGQETTVGEVEEFVLAETAFRETHYKGILKALETAGRLEIPAPPPKRRRGSFGLQSMRIRFAT
ncbi:MAG: three-Cys-motif partner protein TcmP [Myxococcales bacterium]